MITSISHLTLAVTDVERSFKIYHDLLGFKPLVKWDKGAYFLVGDLWFCLNLDVNRKPTNCYTHYAFAVQPEDFAIIVQKFVNAGVQTFKQNTSEGDSFYFLDPDGHKLELYVGDWQSRLAAKKEDQGAWQNVEWFD